MCHYRKLTVQGVSVCSCSFVVCHYRKLTVQGVSVAVRLLCHYRKLGSGSLRSGLSLPQLMDVFVVLALGLLLAVVSLLIELCHHHVTAAPSVCLRCAS